MRILSIHNHYKEVGGEDTVFFAEAELLRNYGHKVQLLALNNNEVNSVSEKLFAAIGVLYNIKSAQIIEKTIKAFKPDVVHVHNFFPLVSPAVFYVCQRYNVPVVMTLHNYRLICPSALLHYNGQVNLENTHKVFPLKPIKEKVYRNSAFQTASVVLTTGIHKMLGTWRGKVNKYITLTPGASSLFLDSSLKLSPEQLVVKPNFTTDVGLGESERNDYFLYIGRLTAEKGISTLLEAHQAGNFKLKIIGDGPLRSQVEAYAASHNNIEYLGFRDRKEAIQILKRSKALIFPSEWLETFGMTLIEAFATGTPVVAAKIGGAAHIVNHGVNGLHFVPKNSASLLSQIDNLDSNDSLAKDLGNSARETYEKLYTPEANYQMLINIYSEVINENKKTTSVI